MGLLGRVVQGLGEGLKTYGALRIEEQKREVEQLYKALAEELRGLYRLQAAKIGADATKEAAEIRRKTALETAAINAAQEERKQQALEAYRSETLAQRAAELEGLTRYREELLKQRQEGQAAIGDYRRKRLELEQQKLFAEALDRAVGGGKKLIGSISPLSRAMGFLPTKEGDAPGQVEFEIPNPAMVEYTTAGGGKAKEFLSLPDDLTDPRSVAKAVLWTAARKQALPALVKELEGSGEKTPTLNSIFSTLNQYYKLKGLQVDKSKLREQAYRALYDKINQKYSFEAGSTVSLKELLFEHEKFGPREVDWVLRIIND